MTTWKNALGVLVVVVSANVSCGDDDMLPIFDAGQVRPPELPPSCDGGGSLTLGEESGVFLGDCGVSTRTLRVEELTGVVVQVELDAPATLQVLGEDGEEVAGVEVPSAAEIGALEIAIALPAGRYSFELTKNGETNFGGTLLASNACERQVSLGAGDTLEGSLDEGDCRDPRPTDRYSFRQVAERRVRLAVEEGFMAALRLLDEDGEVVAERSVIDQVVPVGLYTLVVADDAGAAAGAYTLSATDVDPCFPFDSTLPRSFGGTLEEGDCEQAGIVSDDLRIETDTFQLVRAEWSTAFGSDNRGDHALSVLSEGVRASGVQRVVRGDDGMVSVSWTGVLEPGSHVYSISLLTPGGIPAGGVPYGAGIASPPAPTCREHLQMAPLTDLPVTLYDQTLWDCQEGGNFVFVRSVVVPEARSGNIGLAAPDADISENLLMSLLNADGTQIRRSPLAFGPQVANITTLLNPGLYWIVVQGRRQDTRFQLGIGLR